MAKVVGGRYSSKYAREHARKEYEALCMLQSVFPQDDQYGTLVPLAHLEHAGCGIVVTRLAPGMDLKNYLRTVNAAAMQAACHSCGVWLRKLHGCDAQSQQGQLNVADKIGFLSDRYEAALREDRKIADVYELFVEHGSYIDAETAFAVRQHGDFKPDNMLCDGTRYIGLDIRWRTVGVPVYDLAPFLNHLWLDGRLVAGSRKNRLYDTLETAFLSGYGNVGDMRALRWAQLYFALCYMGEYRLRGRMAAYYAKWKVWPLVGRLAAQLGTT